LRQVHLGCGLVDVPGWINIDIRPAPHIHFRSGVEHLPMLADASVDRIYCSHCLEHISHLRTKDVLTEWRRVLKPGGVLQLSVPDFDLLLHAYVELGNDMEGILCPLMGAQTYAANFHQTMFNERYLTSLLQQAGFDRVRRWQPDETHRLHFKDFSWAECELKGRCFPVSLNLEAVRSP
jgi:predicted SAM-dependent methyltransferase